MNESIWTHLYAYNCLCIYARMKNTNICMYYGIKHVFNYV